MVDSEHLDSWRLNAAFWRGGGNSDILANIERARKLRKEVQLARENLHQKVAALREEMTLLRMKRRTRAKQ